MREYYIALLPFSPIFMLFFLLFIFYLESVVEKIGFTGNKLLQLAELSLYGSPRDRFLYFNHLYNTIEKKYPDTASKMSELIKNSNYNRLNSNEDIFNAVPVDTNTRLDLLKIKSVIDIPFKPIWQPEVSVGLNNILLERRQIENLKNTGIKISKSVLFTGLPGTGKTFAAHWLAKELKVPLLILDLATVISSYLGKTGSNIKYVLEYAKNIECILLLDELDALAKKRDDIQDVGELKRLVTVLLQEIDNWPDGNLLIAATNHPNLLDPAVWRRFDPIITFSYPSRKVISQWMKTFINNFPNDLLNKKESHILYEVFNIIGPGLSYDTIDKYVNRIIKISYLKKLSIGKSISEVLHDHFRHLDKKKSIDIGVLLLHSGLTQRNVEDITGVSRKTLKKYSDQERLNE